LGWDTQIPRNPNPNKTQKSQALQKNHQNLDPNISKFLKFFPNLTQKSQIGILGYFFGKSFQAFGIFWVKVLLIFGLGLGFR
jgi:hypothetical protein